MNNKIYFRVVALVLGVIALVGIILPWLMSAQSDFAVIGGIIAVVVAIPMIVSQGKKVYQMLNEKKQNNEKIN